MKGYNHIRIRTFVLKIPFILVGIVIFHFVTLHQYGYNNPLGINSFVDKIIFNPYFYVKDLIGWVNFSIFFSIFDFCASNVLGHLDNYIPVNSCTTLFVCYNYIWKVARTWVAFEPMCFLASPLYKEEEHYLIPMHKIVLMTKHK